MGKILKVAQREYIETAKTKTFILSVLMLPVVLVGIIFFTRLLSRSKGAARPAVKIAVTDLSNKLAGEIETCFEKYNTSHPQRQILLEELENKRDSDATEKEGKKKLRSGEVTAYVVLDENILEGPGKMHLYTHKPKATNLDILWTIENLLRDTVINWRYQSQDFDRQLLDKLRYVPTERVEVGSSDEEQRIQKESDRITRMVLPFFFMYLLFLGIIGTGQHMLSSIIEEKSSRVIEVLLSAVSAFELMAGKICRAGGNRSDCGMSVGYSGVPDGSVAGPERGC